MTMVETTTLFFVLVAVIPASLLFAVFIRRTRPSWCKSYVKFCLDRKWPLFAFGLFMFLGFSIMSFSQGYRYFGILFLLFVGLQAFCLLKYGFNSLTPEQEAAIDASDPTKIWPFSFWKRAKNGAPGAAADVDSSQS